jgi:sugar lactone lactonase YvrE
MAPPCRAATRSSASLYITTAREALTPAQVASQPHAGDIFACTPGATGRPPNLFAD